MSRPDNLVTVPLGELPGAIRESIRAVLKANGFAVSVGGVDLTDERFERLLGELGRNAAQAIYNLDRSCPVCGGVDEGNTCCPPERT